MGVQFRSGVRGPKYFSKPTVPTAEVLSHENCVRISKRCRERDALRNARNFISAKDAVSEMRRETPYRLHQRETSCQRKTPSVESAAERCISEKCYIGKLREQEALQSAVLA